MSRIFEHELTYLWGLDYRNGTWGMWPFGRVRLSDYAHPGFAARSSFPSEVFPMGVTNVQPWATNDPPFDTSLYPAGTVWVVVAAGSAPTVIRGVGVTTNPLSTSLGTLGTGGVSRRYGYNWRVVGCVPGATGTITIKKTTAGTVVATINPTSDGEWFFDDFVGVDGDTFTVVSSWSGGVPRYESIQPLPAYNATYVPVPSTLPAGYTARNNSDIDRGGTYSDRPQSDPTAPLAGPYPTFETVGIASSDGLAGCPIPGTHGLAQTNIWVDGALRRYDWTPQPFSYSIGATIPSWPNDGRPNWTSVFSDPITNSMAVDDGSRDVTMTVTIAGGSDSFLVEIDAGPLGSESSVYSSSLSASTSVPLGSFSAASVGDAVNFIIKINHPSGMDHFNTSCTILLTIKSTVNIPLPFTAVGRQADGTPVIAPGGYLPSKLGTPPNTRPATRLGSGVTSTSVTGHASVSFIPSASGWYQVTLAGTPINFIGENPFHHSSKHTKSIDRGHSGRPFWSKVDATGTQTAALVTYTPSPTAISGATTLTTNAGNWWAWATYAAASAGSWRVSVKIATAKQLERGFIAEWSLSDSTVVDAEGRVEFISYDLTVGVTETYKGTSNTPAGSPSLADAWIVGTAPTGAWTDHENEVAIWDAIANYWRFYVPKRGSYIELTSTTWMWFDGSAWKTEADPVVSFVIATPGAQTIGLLFGAVTTERDVGIQSPQLIVSVSQV